MKITIESTYDEMECDTCGFNYAEGATVYFDNDLVVELVPSASCYGGVHWDTKQIAEEILRKLGHEVEWD